MPKGLIYIEPCPFCGCEDIETQSLGADREGTIKNAICVDCGATGPHALDEELLAYKEWNKRTKG